MPQRRILYLDHAGLSAYRIGGNSVDAEGTFVNDEAGLQAFGNYLKNHRRSIFMLLADIAEEGFQFEEIPYSSGKDRAAIIKRKLGQNFYGTSFALALSQGRQKTGRRDEQVLLLALTRPQAIDPWLVPLRENQAILSGVYSLPQVIPQLLPKDAPPQELLLVRTRGGLRQAFFANRQLRLSRQTSLVTDSVEESAIATVLEAGKMHQYLASQRLIERNKPLNIRVLVHPAETAAMRERCRDTNELRFELVDLLLEAKQAGLRSPPTDSQTELLFCHLLAKKTPAEQFAPDTERQFFQLWRTRFALAAISTVILVGGLLFTGKQGLEVMRTRDSVDQIKQQTRADQQRYDSALQALPKIPISTADLGALVGRYDEVQKRALGPAPLLGQLSQSLDAFPTINLERIEWKITEALDPPPPAGSPAPPPPPAEMASGPYAQLVAVAHLPIGMAGNQRGQLSLVADFVKHLAATPNTLAVVVQPPVDTQSGKTLRSGEEKQSAEAPRFIFKLTRKL